MPTIVVDLIVIALVAGMTYALMSEGLWGAVLMFFNALFASMIALNFYEPLAGLIIDQVGVDSFISPYADVLMLMVLFIATLLIMRLATENLAPSMVRYPTPVYHIGRVIFAFGGAAVTMGMLILAYETAPAQKRLLGVYDYKYQPFYGTRFDRDMLAFFHYSTGYTFPRNGAGDPDPEFSDRPMLFDPDGAWLVNHQRYRPVGEGEIPEPEPAAEGAAKPGAAGGGGGAPKATP